MSNYSQLLKQLLQFSDTKSIILSNTLGYDISYISKWCSGVKIPSVKSIPTIHKQMSTLFAKEISIKQKESIFLVEFHLEFPKEKESIHDLDFLENAIFSLLNKTYHLDNPNTDIPQEEEISFVFGKNDIVYFVEEKLKSIFLQTSSSRLDFFLTVDFTTVNLHPILSLLSKLKRPEMNIYVSLGIDLEQLQEQGNNKINKLFYLLNRYVNLNIELYNNSRFKNLNILLLKNHIAFQYSLSQEGEFLGFTSIQEKTNFDKVNDFVLGHFKEEDKLFHLANTRKLQKEGYRTTFYTDESFHFFLVHGFEFLLPPSIIDNIAVHAKKNKYSEQDLISILKVKIAWEEIFENSSINFFILKNSMFRYLEKGKLMYMNIDYQTSIEERELHYDYAIKLLEKNPDIHFYIVDEEFVSNNNLNYNIGVFGNDRKMFFKNYYNLERKKEPYFTVVNNKKLLNQIYTLLDQIKDSEHCKEYGVEELKTLWEKYKNMFSRLTEL